MKDIVQMNSQAIELRRQGYSYSDISKKLKVSKTSISNWVRNVRLTENEKNNLENSLKMKRQRSRMQASISIKAKKVFKERVAYDNAEKDFKKFISDPFFTLGLGLYWQHGLKRGNYFQFTSSELNSIRIMIAWIEKYINFHKSKAKYRLFTHFSQKEKENEDYWAQIIGVSRDLFLKTIYSRAISRKDDREYKGSIAVIITRIAVLRMVIAWQKLAMRYYT